MINKVILATLFYASLGFAGIESEIKFCNIKLPSYITYSEKRFNQIDYTNELKFSTSCNTKKTNDASEILKGITGKIPHDYLANLFAFKGIKLIKNNSKIITIQSFKKILATKLSMVTDADIKNIKHDIEHQFIFSDEALDIEITKNKATLAASANQHNKITKVTFSIDYQLEVMTLTSITNLYPYSSDLRPGINIKQLKNLVWKSEIGQLHPIEKSTRGYQLIRIVKKGKPIKVSDLQLKTVIQTGKAISVILVSNGLYIKTNGVSQNSGRIGDTVEVKLSNNKTVRGIVNLGSEYYVKI
jgi:flagella basal body P-ring formation protein FlgA